MIHLIFFFPYNYISWNFDRHTSLNFSVRHIYSLWTVIYAALTVPYVTFNFLDKLLLCIYYAVLGLKNCSGLLLKRHNRSCL